jgi:hypothetical protein
MMAFRQPFVDDTKIIVRTHVAAYQSVGKYSSRRAVYIVPVSRCIRSKSSIQLPAPATGLKPSDPAPGMATLSGRKNVILANGVFAGARFILFQLLGFDLINQMNNGHPSDSAWRASALVCGNCASKRGFFRPPWIINSGGSMMTLWQ